MGESHALSLEVMNEVERPTWSNWHEAVGVIVWPPHLRKTLLIAVVVGTILFCINQLIVVLHGKADASVWLRTGLTYLVPFGVSNYGILLATRRGVG